MQSLVWSVADGMSETYNRFVAFHCIALHSVQCCTMQIAKWKKNREQRETRKVNSHRIHFKSSSQIEFVQSSWKIEFAYNHFDASNVTWQSSSQSYIEAIPFTLLISLAISPTLSILIHPTLTMQCQFDGCCWCNYQRMAKLIPFIFNDEWNDSLEPSTIINHCTILICHWINNVWARQISRDEPNRTGQDWDAVARAASQIFTSAFKLIDNNAHRLWIYELMNFALNFQRNERKRKIDQFDFRNSLSKMAGIPIVAGIQFENETQCVPLWIHDDWKIHFKRIISIWFDRIQFLFWLFACARVYFPLKCAN